jgi:CheY-like chemotaxis protein
MLEHKKKILLVEDLKVFYTDMMRWLNREGYQITLAETKLEAQRCLREEHFHILIADIRLDDSDLAKAEGKELLKEVNQSDLKEVMPRIVVTSHAPSVDDVLDSLQRLSVYRFIIRRGEYRNQLLEAVKELMEDNLRINFELKYEVDSDQLIPTVAKDIHQDVAEFWNWSIDSIYTVDWLIPQIQDLLGKLFFKANSIVIARMTKGLSGTGVIRVAAEWRHGWGPEYVVKIGRRDKIKTEFENYEQYVKYFLPNFAITGIDVKYSRHLGAIWYTLAAGALGKLGEFDDFYERASGDEIVDCLRRLFQNSCRYWYEERDSKFENLPQLYFKAFNLDTDKLIKRAKEIIPEFNPQGHTFCFEEIPDCYIPNPIRWLIEHKDDWKLRVFISTTHGDLTGRNIMVEYTGGVSAHCWLIDFYRTYKSHILRDFVILETDIRYRLNPTNNLQEFLQVENILLDLIQNRDVDIAALPDRLKKSVAVIKALREMGRIFSRGTEYTEENRQEYLVALLMATLNVVRLSHIKREQKCQALLSATLISIELDRLMGRNPQRPDLRRYSKLSREV